MAHQMRARPVVHSRCVQIRTTDIVTDAVSMLSTKGTDGEIPLVLIPSARNTMSMVLQVPTGVACLMQRFGKDLEEEAKPGLHILPSYYRIAYVVSKQACTYDAPVRACPTADDVRVNIDIVIVFSITHASQFVYKLGVRNFDEYLSGTVDEAIRRLVRMRTAEDVYSLRGSDEHSGKMLQILNEQFKERCGVDFIDLKVISVWLPKALADSKENTTVMEKKMEKLETQQEYEIMQIQQEHDMKIEELRLKSEQVLVAEAGRKRRAQIDYEQRNVKTQEEGAVALIEAESKAMFAKMTIEGQEQRTKTQLDTFHLREIAKAQALAMEVTMKADLAQEEASIAAAWQEEKMICEAAATKSEAIAEKEASTCLVAKRQHELDLREKNIITRLAEQGRFNLVGVPGDKMIHAMMTGAFEGKDK